MYPEQLPDEVSTSSAEANNEKCELIGNATSGRRKNRASNHSNQMKGSHQSNHLHNSPNDNQSNLNHPFQRNSGRFRSKAIRKNQRPNENGLFNGQYHNFIHFDVRPHYGRQFDSKFNGKFDRTFDKQVFNQFDSGTIDQNLIDRILRDKQQLINKQIVKKPERQMGDYQFEKMNGVLIANQENPSAVFHEIYFHKQPIDECQNRMNNHMMNQTTNGQLGHRLNDQINHKINDQINHEINDQTNGQMNDQNSHKQFINSPQDSLQNSPAVLSIESSDVNFSLGKHLSNSSLNKSIALNGSTNSSINLANRSLKKSLNKSHHKQYNTSSPVVTGQQINNGFGVASDQMIQNSDKQQTNYNLLNSLLNNGAITNINSNSSLNTVLNTSLGNSKTNQLYKILPNSTAECNSNDSLSVTLTPFNQTTHQVTQQMNQDLSKVNHQITQSQNNQQVNQLVKNQIQPDQLFNLMNGQVVSNPHVEAAISEQMLIAKLSDALINDENVCESLKSDLRGEEKKNEFKTGKKNKRAVSDSNPFKNHLNVTKLNSQLNAQFMNNQMNSNSINQQVNHQQSNHLINSQPTDAQHSIFSQNDKVNSSTAVRHVKSEIKNSESERYVCEKKSNFNQYSNHPQNHPPFYKPPRYQDKIMTPDSYHLDNNREHNWKQRKGNFNRFYGDKKQSHLNKSNSAHFVASVSIPHYPKMIHSYHDIVSNQIWKLYILLRQTPESYERKIELRQSLYRALKHDLVHDLYMVGSSLNGLGTITSDVDMCLLLPQHLGDIDQSTQAIPILKIVMDIIARKLDFVDNIRLIEAKVPILKFSDKKGNIEIDLNINNIVGIRNTQLVKCYTRLDWRITPLAIAIKAWAHFNQINNAHKKSISSYTFVLMLIHYLQVDCTPPILPCLHSLMPNSFRTDSNVKELNLFEDLPEFRSENKQSLSELFIGFLDYYGNRFNYISDVISVRTGRIMKKEVAREYRSPKNTSTQWNFICCEEPFDRTNTARSVSDFESYKRVTKCFQSSYCRIKNTHNLVAILNLEHLFGLNGLNSALSNSNLNDLDSSKSCNQSNSGKE